jgi:hypothetical protein
VTLLNVTAAANVSSGGARGCGRQGCGINGTGYGGGLYRGASVSVTNTILAANTAASGPNCFGTVNSGGHNLLGKKEGCFGFTAPGDLLKTDPLLGPLQDNGGPTYTMELGSGSPAIDAADDVICAAPPVRGVDQRGKPRPGGSHCDMGAFEVEP